MKYLGKITDDKDLVTKEYVDSENEVQCPYIVGTQNASTNVWTGTAPFASLETGQQIRYKLPYAGTSSAATLNLTLSGGDTTGAISVLRNSGSTVTTHFAAGSIIYLTYDGTRWRVSAFYDGNTNTIGYQLRTNSGTRPASDKGYRYRMWFSSADDTEWVPANTSTSTNATTARTANTTPIDPFGSIIYYSTNGTTSAAADLTATACWQQYSFAIGYSFTDSLSLTAHDPVYLKCTPQSDGSAVMQGTTQSLPTTNDGYIYIYLGIAYSATNIELNIHHPVYYHDGTGIRLWTGAEAGTVLTSLAATPSAVKSAYDLATTVNTNSYQVMTACVSAVVTGLSSTSKKMTLESSVNCSNHCSISSGGIKCANAGCVLVSGQVQFYDVNDNNVCNLAIYKNSAAIAVNSSRSANDRTTLVISPHLIQVAANDVFYIYVSNTSASAGQAGATSSSVTDADKAKNYMTVQYVKVTT